MAMRETSSGSARLQLNSRVWPVVTIVLLTVEILDPSAVWQALLVAFGGAWLVCYLWARSLKENLSLGRVMRFGWVQVGDKLEEELNLFNDGLFPATWLEVIDRSTIPGYSISRATGVDGMSETSWRTSGTCARRGVYKLGGTTILTGDPLGIYQLEIDQPESATLMVMPPVISLPSIKVAPGGWLGEGRPRPNASEKTASAATLRQYVPGDSLRLVHWPSTARHNELYIHLLEGAPAGDWWLALDLDRAVQAGLDEADSTTELGIILAASLADQGLRARRPVGLLVNSQSPAWMRPQPGEQRRWEILRTLATLDPGDTTLAHLLTSAGASFGHQSSLIVITPSTDSSWLQPLAGLMWRGITPTVILIDASSFGAATDTKSMDGVLTDMGIAHHIVTRDLLQAPEARPGETGQWDWRIMPTGKAVPMHRPSDMTWKKLR
ncbi:MAG TPA: DUF58 domain-containing protein [Anaerolineales bacterium]